MGEEASRAKFEFGAAREKVGTIEGLVAIKCGTRRVLHQKVAK